MTENPIVGKYYDYTHCKYRGENIDLHTFKYKGCWNCRHFSRLENFPFYNVKEASKILSKSESTIGRWIKKGKLDGNLFRKERREFSLGAYRKYFIKKESIEEILKYE